MENIQTYQQTATIDIAQRQQRVLRNTYALLALSMVPTILGALVGVQLKFSFLAGSPFIAFMLFLGVAWAFMWGIETLSGDPLYYMFRTLRVAGFRDL